MPPRIKLAALFPRDTGPGSRAEAITTLRDYQLLCGDHRACSGHPPSALPCHIKMELFGRSLVTKEVKSTYQLKAVTCRRANTKPQTPSSPGKGRKGLLSWARLVPAAAQHTQAAPTLC